MSAWTASNIPSQRGRTAIVTGTGGIGLETAAALAEAQAMVIIAGRDASKGASAVAEVRSRVPGANVRFEVLDLANHRSIAAFGDRMLQQFTGIDLLINNAAVMNPPARQVTADGHELQFGTNYLGHFALTAALLPLLRRRSQARVVSLSSVAARDGRIDFANLQSERGYQPMTAYAQSKLACLMFAFELQRQSDRQEWGITSVGAHPGISRTELIPNGAGTGSLAGRARKYLWFLFQPASQGAWPSLYAATAPEALGGHYYGPDRLGETRGHPRSARVPPQALDREVAARLWQESVRLTGATFE
ncbi:MAG: SDR family oxidoreductase [Gemmatimonadaceae bacterium]|nr:SDR family oxidoreductase [Gemmatimonadaceae bacterium]